MADEVSMSIGLVGQPPLTVYTYASGLVTLSARPDPAVLSYADIQVTTGRIEAFARAVRSGSVPAPGPPVPPMDYRFRVEAGDPGTVVCRFHSDNLNIAATLVMATQVTTFDPRPQRTITWSDFEVYCGWLQTLVSLVRRFKS